MPSLSWKVLFPIMCMLCPDKGISPNLDLMVYGNFVVIMIVLCLYMYTSMYVYHCVTGLLEIMII